MPGREWPATTCATPHWVELRLHCAANSTISTYCIRTIGTLASARLSAGLEIDRASIFRSIIRLSGPLCLRSVCCYRTPAEFFASMASVSRDWSFMKAALSYSDVITTVSLTYAREILAAGRGYGAV